jgi:hypothetical protein
MKIVIACVALAVALASPALAQAKSKKERNMVDTQSWQSRQVWSQYGPMGDNRRSHAPNPAWDVYRGTGQYAGSDPDPHVRGMLRRDTGYDD